MQRIGNALPIIVTFIVALAVTFSWGIESVYGMTPIKIEAESILDASDNSESEVETTSQVSGPEESSVEETSSEEPEKENSSEAVETSGTGEAKGKIVAQFMSPYNAKYAYNNVYLKNTSGLAVDIKTELSAGVKINIKKSAEPEVLIVHTHATECFMYEDRDYYTANDPSRTTDNAKNITHIGDIVAERLEAAGIGVIHDKTQHDYPSYTGSYSRAAVTIKEYLKKYPSIKIVLDIHRDSIALNDTDRLRPVAEVNGKKAAQVMLCMGSQSGSVTSFPNWKENFRLALKMQQTMEVMYPGLARPMVLASKLYNQNLTTGSLLLEVGTESNLLSEAEYAAELAGNALVSVLNTLG